MSKSLTMRRSRRKARQRTPDLFERARDQDLLNIPAVRTIACRAGVGPALALALAELAGLTKER